jgi:hypothetical protein
MKNKNVEICKKLDYLKKRKYPWKHFHRYKKVLIKLKYLLPFDEWNNLYESHLLWVQGFGSKMYFRICRELYNKYNLYEGGL